MIFQTLTQVFLRKLPNSGWNRRPVSDIDRLATVVVSKESRLTVGQPTMRVTRDSFCPNPNKATKAHLFY